MYTVTGKFDFNYRNVTTLAPVETRNVTGNLTALMEIIHNKRKTSAEEFWQ